MTPEVLLLGPGPSPVSHRVRAAMSAPLIGHLDPEFVALMDRVQADLRCVLRTDSTFTLPISGTGSAGMEMCLANLVEPLDRVVVGVHGVFGERMAEIARRLGGEVVEVRAEPGSALDAQAMRAAIRQGATKLVAFVHVETSTGVLQPHAEILAAAGEVGALTLLDCVTSLGGTTVEVGAWGVDAVYSGTQKCLSVPPGLAPVTLSATALERIARRRRAPPSWYLDAKLLGSYWGGERIYHHTAPISMVYALAAGLREVVEEGLEQRHARHRHVAQALWRGLAALGMECLVADALRAPMLTTVRVPDAIDELAVRRHLRAQHAIEIGGGMGALQGRVWRIGLMGHGARLESVLRVLAALGDALAQQGRRLDVSSALREAQRGSA